MTEVAKKEERIEFSVVFLLCVYRLPPDRGGLTQHIKHTSTLSPHSKWMMNYGSSELTESIFWTVLKGEVGTPRRLAVPSSIDWRSPLFCGCRPEEDECTKGLRNLKVRSGPRTTIESLTKSFLKEKLVERLAPIVPCNWAAVVWNRENSFETKN